MRWWGVLGAGVIGFLAGWCARARLEPLAIEPKPAAEPAEPAEEDSTELDAVDLDPLLVRARALAEREPVDRESLADLTWIEDKIFHELDVVARVWMKHMDDAALLARKNACEVAYKELLGLSDRAVNRVFTPPAIESAPWRDLLTDASAWKSSELPGFEHPLTDGVLHLVGPDPAAGGMGVMSIGDAEAWRDFVVEIEFTLHRGSVELFFRLPPLWQKNVESRELVLQDGSIELDRKYLFTFTILGSILIQDVHASDMSPTYDTISWVQVRKGALGIAVPRETEVEITRLRAKILR